MPATLFLDLDGPILDVSERYFRVHEDILMSLGSRCLAGRAEYWEMRRGREAFSEILRKYSERQVDEGAFADEWLRRIERLDYLCFDTVNPGVKKALGRLQGRFELVLVTLRQSREGVIHQLRQLSLGHLFSTVLTAPPLRSQSWKAKRDLIAASGLLLTGAWIVGDSEVDILAGKALGMRTVGVLSGIRNETALKEIAPDFIVEDLNHLPRMD